MCMVEDTLLVRPGPKQRTLSFIFRARSSHVAVIDMHSERLLLSAQVRALPPGPSGASAASRRAFSAALAAEARGSDSSSAELVDAPQLYA